MRTLIIALALVCFSNLEAGEKCHLDYLWSYTYQNSSGTRAESTDQYRTDGYALRPSQTFLADNWQECREMALKATAEIPVIINAVGYTNNQAGFPTRNKAIFTCFTYVAWKFNDSYVWNSSGKVNSYTLKLFSKAGKGDQRSDYDGAILYP